MDDLFQAVLSDVLADLIVKAAQRFWGTTRFVRRSARDELIDVDVATMVHQRLSSSSFLDAVQPPDATDQVILVIREFATSKEMETLVWDLLTNGMTGVEHRADHTYTIWSLLLHGMPNHVAESTASRIDDYLDNLLKVGGDLVPSLPGFEKAQAAREPTARAGVTQASNLALARLATLMDHEATTMKSLDASLSKLRNSIAAVHGSIRPANMDSHSSVTLSQLYVPPSLAAAQFRDRQVISGSTANLSTIELIIRESRCVVILGDPGAGKSTTGEYISWLLASRAGGYSRGTLTVPVILRRHSQQIQTDGGLDVVGALQSTARYLYQTPLSREATEYLCASGRLGVVFDGLDEILNAETRRQVVSSISAFAIQYPRAAVVVTSRKVGYGIAPFAEDEFEIFELLPFDDAQVEAYAHKWFHLVAPSTHTARELAEAFMRESEVNIRDLRNNPLLLSLLCSLYRRQTSLPRNRPAIYEACAELLFDTWDRSRALRPTFEFENHIDGAIQDIAWWLFNMAEIDVGVREESLVERAALYFHSWQFADMATARRSAKEFVDFCKGRAWVLSDRELTEGDIQFGFTHRTFLEYFAAKYLCQSYDERAVVDFVLLHANEPRWHMVCLLALQINGNRLGFRDMAAQALADRATEIDVDVSYRQLCVGVLESIPLRPSSVEAISAVSLKPVLDAVAHAQTHAPLASSTLPTHGWLNGSSIAIENYRAVVAFLRGYVRSSPTDARTVRQLLPLMLDLLVNEVCSPSDARRLVLDFRDDVQPLLVRTIHGEAWAEAAVMMLQFTGDLILMEGTILGNVGPEVVSPVKSVWGLRPLPNGLETFLWVLNVGDAASTPWLLDVGMKLRRKVQPAISSRLLGAWRRGYLPSAFWTLIQGAPSTMWEPPEELVALGTRFTLGLVELVEASSMTTTLEHLSRQHWGVLPFIGPMIARRHGLQGGGDHARALAHARALGFVDWYANPEFSILQ